MNKLHNKEEVKSVKIKVVFDSSKTSVKKGAHAIGCQN